MAELDLLQVEPRHAEKQSDGFALSRQDHASLLRVADAILQVGLIEADDLHKMSFVVWCGGLVRTARTITRCFSSSTSYKTRYLPTRSSHTGSSCSQGGLRPTSIFLFRVCRQGLSCHCSSILSRMRLRAVARSAFKSSSTPSAYSIVNISESSADDLSFNYSD